MNDLTPDEIYWVITTAVIFLFVVIDTLVTLIVRRRR